MFKKILLSSILALSATVAHAQTPVVNKDYAPIEINPSQALVEPKAGKPVLIEFFWYGCPHCYHMEPLVKKLVQERKDSIEYIRYPAVFPRWVSGAKLYFTLEQMNLLDKLHDKVFDTIQKDRNNIMDNKEKRDAFLKEQGVDVAEFDKIYDSFGINTKVNQAQAISLAYKLESSPSFIINNQYVITPSLSGSYDGTIKSINLILDNLK